MIQPPPLPAFNPYAAPSARVEDAVTQQLVLADRITRLAAVILDGLVFLLPAALIGIGAAMMAGTGAKSATDASTVGITMILLMVGLLLMVALFVVNMVLLHRHGQTLGKRWLKIKVVLADGNRCGLARYCNTATANYCQQFPHAIVSPRHRHKARVHVPLPSSERHPRQASGLGGTSGHTGRFA